KRSQLYEFIDRTSSTQQTTMPLKRPKTMTTVKSVESISTPDNSSEDSKSRGQISANNSEKNTAI
ncbi:11128_t:CDS:1, partial [Paraglomus occultum]